MNRLHSLVKADAKAVDIILSKVLLKLSGLFAYRVLRLLKTICVSSVLTVIVRFLHLIAPPCKHNKPWEGLLS